MELLYLVSYRLTVGPGHCLSDFSVTVQKVLRNWKYQTGPWGFSLSWSKYKGWWYLYCQYNNIPLSTYPPIAYTGKEYTSYS